MGDVWRYCVFAVHDHGERLAVVSLLEGGLPADQHEEDYPQTPDICRDTHRMAHNRIAKWDFFRDGCINEKKKKKRMADQHSEAHMSFLLSDLVTKKIRSAIPSSKEA